MYRWLGVEAVSTATPPTLAPTVKSSASTMLADPWVRSNCPSTREATVPAPATIGGTAAIVRSRPIVTRGVCARNRNAKCFKDRSRHPYKLDEHSGLAELQYRIQRKT